MSEELIERLKTDILWHERRGNETIAQDLREAVAALSPVHGPAAQGPIERLKAAIEGECDGLAIDDKTAQAILHHIAAEGETPADIRVLREANLALASESHELQQVLANLYDQVHEFCVKEGEADFYTGPALHLLSRLRPLEYSWPFTTPPHAASPSQPSSAERTLKAIFAHWNEFGPEHGFGELMDRAQEHHPVAQAADSGEPVARDWFDTVVQLERMASTAIHQSPADQRNILEDIAERLSRLTHHAVTTSPAPAPGQSGKLTHERIAALALECGIYADTRRFAAALLAESSGQSGKGEAPTVKQLQEMAYILRLVPRGEPVNLVFLEKLRDQFNAAMQVAQPGEGS